LVDAGAQAGGRDRVDHQLSGDAPGDRSGRHGRDVLADREPPAGPPSRAAQRDHGELGLPGLGAVPDGQEDAEAREQHQRDGEHRHQQVGG
jgi:hypothetical protein